MAACECVWVAKSKSEKISVKFEYPSLLKINKARMWWSSNLNGFFLLKDQVAAERGKRMDSKVYVCACVDAHAHINDKHKDERAENYKVFDVCSLSLPFSIHLAGVVFDTRTGKNVEWIKYNILSFCRQSQ